MTNIPQGSSPYPSKIYYPNVSGDTYGSNKMNIGGPSGTNMTLNKQPEFDSFIREKRKPENISPGSSTSKKAKNEPTERNSRNIFWNVQKNLRKILPVSIPIIKQDKYGADDIKTYKTYPGQNNPYLGNFYQVDPKYFRGAALVRDYNVKGTTNLREVRLNPNSIAELKKHGVVAVIDLRNETSKIATNAEKELVTGNNMKYKNIHMYTDRDPTEEQCRDFLRTVEEFQKLGPIYVHCKGGIDRTGTMTAMYEYIMHNKSRDDVKKQMLECGYWSRPEGHKAYGLGQFVLNNDIWPKLKEERANQHQRRSFGPA